MEVTKETLERWRAILRNYWASPCSGSDGDEGEEFNNDDIQSITDEIDAMLLDPSEEQLRKAWRG